MARNNFYKDLLFTRMISTIHADDFPQSFPFHWHKYIEIVALPGNANSSGLPTLCINQTTYQLNPGDILLI